MKRFLIPGVWFAAAVAWIANAMTGLDAPDRTAAFYLMIAMFIPIHGLILVGLIGLWRADVVGRAWWARAGLGAAIGARVLYILAEFVCLAVGYDDEVVLLPVAAMLTAIGLVVAGIGAIRAARWEGWRRFAPITMGIYPFVFMFPILALTHARPNLFVSMWALTYVLIGAASLRPRMQGERERPEHAVVPR